PGLGCFVVNCQLLTVHTSNPMTTTPCGAPMLMCDVTTFKTLDQIASADQPQIGGKAFNCARLKQAGIPVPDGLVVPTDATDEQIHAIGAHPWLHTDHDAAPLAVQQ